MDDGVFRWVMLAGFVAVVGVTAPHRVRAGTNEKLDRRKEGAFMLAALRPAGAALWLGIIAYMISPATRRQIAGGVVRGALLVTLVGAATGVVTAFVIARWLSTVVTGVDVHDPIAFVAGPLVLLIVVLVASVAPARRAAAVDPATTLRA